MSINTNPQIPQITQINLQSVDYQERMQAAMKRGFQTRDAEMNLGQLVGDLQRKTDV